MSGHVLVLNQNYEPLHICGLRRAMIMLGRGKAEILEHSDRPLRSERIKSFMPSVIRLSYQVKRPRPRAVLTRKEVYSRDDYTCQYCGRTGGLLTLDHVIPRQKGGKHTWENLVTACRQCNHRKGNRSPEEVGLRLRSVPKQPHVSAYYILYRFLQGQATWRKFVPEWELVKLA